MSLRMNMARNLQHLVSQTGSANFVSREIGINRQQFEKYLKGRSLPAASTLQKICRYFNITEEALFAADPAMEADDADAEKQETYPDALLPLLAEPAASIKPGIYYLWMTVPSCPDQFVCAPIVIERRNHSVMFRRITGSAESRARLWWHRVGDHKGLVVERLNWLILVGVNQRGNQEPSMIRLKWVPLSSAVLGGHAAIFTPSGISFSAACMRPAPAGTTFRQALRQSRQFERNDSSIDPMTKMVLDQQRQELMQIIERDVSL